MQFKLLLALVDEERVEPILKAAREAGATGATVITSARGEGLVPEKTFFGLDLRRSRDVVLLVVEEHLSRAILETVAEAGRFESDPGSGIVLELAVDDAIGLSSQMKAVSKKVEDQL